MLAGFARKPFLKSVTVPNASHTEDVQQEQSREFSPFQAKFTVSETKRQEGAKHGASNMVEVTRANQGGVPDSEKKILCVDVRDRGGVQSIAGEGGTRTQGS